MSTTPTCVEKEEEEVTRKELVEWKKTMASKLDTAMKMVNVVSARLDYLEKVFCTKAQVLDLVDLEISMRHGELIQEAREAMKKIEGEESAKVMQAERELVDSSLSAALESGASVSGAMGHGILNTEEAK